MEIDYHKVEAFVRTGLIRYRDMMDFEDAIQEGLVRAWKDAEEGQKNELWIMRRAKHWAWSILTNDYKLPTGHPGRDLEGRTKSSGDASREKIRAYMEEFVKLHDRAPFYREIAAGIGVSKDTVAHHMKYMRAHGNVTVQYRTNGDRRRVDRSAYVHSPLMVKGLEGDEDIDPEAERQAAAPSAEDVFMATETFRGLLSPISVESQQSLFMSHALDWTYKQIGEFFDGPSAHSKGYRMLLKAHQEVRDKVYRVPGPVTKSPKRRGGRPRKPDCPKGHAYTLENTGTYSSGQRYCRECNRLKSQAYNAKMRAK